MNFNHLDFWRENSNLALVCSIQLRIIGDEASANRESSFGATVSDEQDIILMLIRKIIHFSGSQLMIMITELESGFAYLAKASSGGKHSAGGWRTEFFSDSEFSGWGRHHNSAFRNPKLKL